MVTSIEVYEDGVGFLLGDSTTRLGEHVCKYEWYCSECKKSKSAKSAVVDKEGWTQIRLDCDHTEVFGLGDLEDMELVETTEADSCSSRSSALIETEVNRLIQEEFKETITNKGLIRLKQIRSEVARLMDEACVIIGGSNGPLGRWVPFLERNLPKEIDGLIEEIEGTDCS